MQGKPEIVKGLFRLTPRDGIFPIWRLALEVIAEKRSITLADEEGVTKNAGQLLSLLNEAQIRFAKDKMFSPFECVDNERQLVRWRLTSGFRENLISRLFPNILRFIDQCDDRNFELLCGVACRFLGAESVYVLPPSDDGGLDFVALVPAYTASPMFCSGRDGLRIVGQSKMYRSSKVSNSEIKLHAQTINELRERNPHIVSRVPTWLLSSKSPMIGSVAGYSGHQDGALRVSHSHGIVASDAIDLAYILSIPKKFHFRYDAEAVFAKLRAECADIERLSLM